MNLQRSLERVAHRSPLAWAWGLTLLVYAILLVLALCTPFLLWKGLEEAGQENAGVLGAIVGFVFMICAMTGLEARVRRGTSRPFVRLIHRVHWRRRIADVMVRMRMSDERLLQILSCPEFKGYGYRDWVVQSIREDTGLRLLGLARSTCG